MTVRELIKELRKVNPDLQVHMDCEHGGSHHDVLGTWTHEKCLVLWPNGANYIEDCEGES